MWYLELRDHFMDFALRKEPFQEKLKNWDFELHKIKVDIV